MTTIVFDPVCGMSLDPTKALHTSDYETQTYYFCSPGCKQAFDATPAQYVEARRQIKANMSLGGHSRHSAVSAQVNTSRPHMEQLPGAKTASAQDLFAREVTGLLDSRSLTSIELKDGETFDLRATPVVRRIGDATVKMLGYNGSIPGPELRVKQGAEVTVEFHNDMDLETTVHWHGLRHDNFFDGVPTGPHAGVQAPVPPGGSFTYRLRFPDAGTYWYHPHVREDYAQEQGLYGSITVTPSDPSYWSPANGELSIILDDILIEDGQIAPFSRSGSDHTAMGRFGNVMLVNGETDFAMDARTGEVIRLYLTNTANTRFFNFQLPGARLKLVGGDNGRLEHQTFVENVLVAPSERAIVDVLFERSGRLSMEHNTPDKTYVLGTVTVCEEPVERAYAAEFGTLRSCPDLGAERANLGHDLERAPDKSIAIVGLMPGMAPHGGTGHGDQEVAAIEWEDTMEPMNRMSTPETMLWKIVDRETGAENHAIDWTFRRHERVKIRIVNEPGSDHPMPHPFHIHGERFLVLSRGGVPNRNLCWKDTVLVNTGETLDILLDASNPGIWMAHCHIAEHLEGGMMFSFRVIGTAHQNDAALRRGELSPT